MLHEMAALAIIESNVTCWIIDREEGTCGVPGQYSRMSCSREEREVVCGQVRHSIDSQRMKHLVRWKRLTRRLRQPGEGKIRDEIALIGRPGSEIGGPEVDAGCKNGNVTGLPDRK